MPDKPLKYITPFEKIEYDYIKNILNWENVREFGFLDRSRRSEQTQGPPGQGGNIPNPYGITLPPYDRNIIIDETFLNYEQFETYEFVNQVGDVRAFKLRVNSPNLNFYFTMDLGEKVDGVALYRSTRNELRDYLSLWKIGVSIEPGYLPDNKVRDLKTFKDEYMATGCWALMPVETSWSFGRVGRNQIIFWLTTNQTPGASAACILPQSGFVYFNVERTSYPKYPTKLQSGGNSPDYYDELLGGFRLKIENRGLGGRDAEFTERNYPLINPVQPTGDE